MLGALMMHMSKTYHSGKYNWAKQEEEIMMQIYVHVWQFDGWMRLVFSWPSNISVSLQGLLGISVGL
jgi:hypothetical protein